MPNTLHDPTAPANIQLLQPVHQRHTWSNNLFAILEDDAPYNDDDNIADNLTVQANNCTNGATLGTSLQLVRQPARRSYTSIVLTNHHASTVHDLRPTLTPTLIPQPQLTTAMVFASTTIANLLTIEPQCLLWFTMPTVNPTTLKDQQPYPQLIPPDEDKYNTTI